MGRRVVAIIIATAFLNWSDSHASDLTWEQEYWVPEGEVWIVSWKNPYSPYEIIPMYDMRIIEGNYEIVDPDLIFNQSDGHGVANLIARSRSFMGQVRVYAGSKFQVANDILEFEVKRLKSQ